TFAVSVGAVQDAFVGSLSVRGLDGDEARRAFTSARCEEVVAALALVAAAAVEQRAPARKILSLRVAEIATPAEPVPVERPAPLLPWGAAAGVGLAFEGGAAP